MLSGIVFSPQFLSLVVYFSLVYCASEYHIFIFACDETIEVVYRFILKGHCQI
jgi:hypothetical protein